MNQVSIATPRQRKRGSNATCRVSLSLNKSTVAAIRSAIGPNGNLSAFTERVMLERIAKSYQSTNPDNRKL